MKKEVWAWSIYDLANTAFSALFVTFFFPFFIVAHLGGNEFHVGLVFGLSMLLAGILVPILGAMSDQTQRRIPFIVVFTIICVSFTILVAFSNLFAALLFGLLANFFYHAALDVYDAKLFDISTKKNIAHISGYGTALGYVGTILSLVMAYFILQRYGWETKLGTQAIFIGTAIFFLIFSLYTFFNLKDKIIKKVKTNVTTIKNAIAQVKYSLTTIPKHRGLWFFLLASFLYTDGMNTVIIFLFLFGREQIGITVQQFFPIFAAMAVTAALGALLFGRLSDRIGHRRALFIILFIWIAVIIMLIIKTTFVTYVIAGLLGGAALGATWTVVRPLLVELAPKHKIAELFGFQGLTEKFSGVLGPIIFGFVVVQAGYTPALFVVLVLFILGALILRFVPGPKFNMRWFTR